MNDESLEIKRIGGTFVTQTLNTTEMPNKKRPVVTPEKLGQNPFTYTLQIPVTEVISGIEFVGTLDGVIANKRFYIEDTPKVELYMHETARSNAAGLSDKAQRMYIHILYSLNRKQDYLYLNKAFYMRENRVKSTSTFYEAIKELIRYNYIQKTPIGEVYWINPHRFFPGNRVNKYPDNIVVGDEPWDRRKSPTVEKTHIEKKPFKWNSNNESEQESIE